MSPRYIKQGSHQMNRRERRTSGLGGAGERRGGKQAEKIPNHAAAGSFVAMVFTVPHLHPCHTDTVTHRSKNQTVERECRKITKLLYFQTSSEMHAPNSKPARLLYKQEILSDYTANYGKCVFSRSSRCVISMHAEVVM